MRIRSLLVTVFGVAIAGGSVFLAREYMLETSNAAVAMQEPATVSVVVSRADVEFGQALEPQMVGLQEWPRGSVPRGAFTSLDQVLPTQGGEPRRAKSALYTGEVLLGSKVSDFGEKVTIVQKLGENQRAVAISVNAQTGVGGFVTPGDFVDVVLTTSSGGGLRALTILQKVRVIAVDQVAADTVNDPNVARTVTVEVSPLQSQKLALAQSAGRLSLSLRTTEEIVDEPLDFVEMRDILQEKSPVEDAAPKKPQIIIRRGTTETAVDVN